VLNVRGSDVSFNPVFLAHLLVRAGGATLFVPRSERCRRLCAPSGRRWRALAGYDQLAAQLSAAAAGQCDPGSTRGASTAGVLQSLPAAVRRIEQINPSTLAKAVKNDAEVGLIRTTMEQDGAALAEFFAWFEQAVARREKDHRN